MQGFKDEFFAKEKDCQSSELVYISDLLGFENVNFPRKFRTIQIITLIALNALFARTMMTKITNLWLSQKICKSNCTRTSFGQCFQIECTDMFDMKNFKALQIGSKVFWIMWWKMRHIVSHSSEIGDAKDTATCLAVVFTTFRKNHCVIDGVLNALPSWMFTFRSFQREKSQIVCRKGLLAISQNRKVIGLDHPFVWWKSDCPVLVAAEK